MVAVVDYGVGNVSSIVNMLTKIGVDAMLVQHSKDIEVADKLILPGVGSFDTGMRKLMESGLTDSILKHTVTKNKPLLGICLGMQMLGRGSEEGNARGLELIPFESVRFRSEDCRNLKIPHMGWNVVTMEQKDDIVLQGLDSQQRYYFVHSYHAKCDHEENVLMSCDYCYSFPAAVKKSKIYGFQFHPEKSHKFGMALLANFARMA